MATLASGSISKSAEVPKVETTKAATTSADRLDLLERSMTPPYNRAIPLSSRSSTAGADVDGRDEKHEHDD